MKKKRTLSVVVSRYCWRAIVFLAIAISMFSNGTAIASPLNAVPFTNTLQIADLQIPQFAERAATLVGPRDNYAIPFYIRPAPNQQPVGYGMSGDAVTVTDQFGDYLMEDDPSATWSHIRLEKAPYTEGWLRGRFLSMQTEDSSTEANSP